MNVLCLGSEVIGAELAVDLVRVFLARHASTAASATSDGSKKIEELEKDSMPERSRLHRLSRARPERLDRLPLARHARRPASSRG